MRIITLLLATMLGAFSAGGQSFFQTVSGACASDGQVEVGTRFTTTAAGYITRLRFYKCSPGTEVYPLKLYSGTTLMASANFSGSATGWQTVAINPVRIIPGANYTVSYWTPSGRYQAVSTYPWPVTTGPLRATGGVYRYKTSNNNDLPTSVFQTSNYFVDVVFTSDTTTTPPPTAAGDSVYIAGELFLRASTIKKDTVTLPTYCPDTSWIYMEGWDTVATGIDTKHYYDQYEITMPANNRIRWRLYIEKFWRRQISRDGGATWTDD